MDDRSLTTPNANVPDAGTAPPQPGQPPTAQPNPTQAAQPGQPNGQPAQSAPTQPAGAPSNKPDADTAAGASIPAAAVNNPAVPSQKLATEADLNKTSPTPKHSWIHSAAEALAGGPRYTYKVDDAGNMVPTKIPVSTAHLGLAIALEAISSAAAGAGQHGPGAEGRAAALGEQRGEQIAAQRRQDDQQARQNALGDSKYKQQVTEANMRNYQLATLVGTQSKEVSQVLPDAWKPITDAIDNKEINLPGVTSMFESDAAASVTNGKTNITNTLLIPYGDAQPIMENGQQKVVNGIPVWGHNYKVIPNAAQAKVTLTQKMQDEGHKLGMFLNPDGSPAQIGTPDWPFADLAQKMSEVAQVRVGEQLLQQHKDDAHDMLGIPTKDLGDLATQVRGNDQMKTALKLYSKMAGATNADGTPAQIDTILGHMNAVDPQSTGVLMKYLGLSYQDMTKMQNQRLKDRAAATAEGKDKEVLPETLEKANSIIANPAETPERKQWAQGVVTLDQQQKASLKKRELQDTRNVQDSDIDKAAHTMVDDPTNIASIRNIASMRSDERLRLFNAATEYARSQGKKFDQSSADRKAKMLDSYENGKQADQIQSYQTFLKHDADLYTALQNFGRPGYTPAWVDKPLNWLEKNATSNPEIGAYLAKIQPVKDEIQTFLKNNKAPLSQDVDDMSKILDPGQSPRYLQSVAKSLAQTGQFRLDSVNSRFKHEFKQDFDGLYDDESKHALDVLGVPRLGETPVKDTNGNVIGFTMPGKNGMRPVTGGQ